MPKVVSVKLQVKVPGVADIEGTWEPDRSETTAAWELYVELVTRTPLGDRPGLEGSVRESLNSIYSLFDSTRAILRTHGPTVARPKLWKRVSPMRSFKRKPSLGGLAESGKPLTFGILAVSMLNLVLRPFLTCWHPRFQDWELNNPGTDENAWHRRGDFFQDMNELRDSLNEYASTFAKVAGVPGLVST